MKKLIQLTADLAILPHHISAVQHVNDDSCRVFMTGQPATDTAGFLVSLPCDVVLDEINDALKQECIDKSAIDQSGILGEPGTGYEPPARRGPFRCDNCHYFRPDNSSCGERHMVALSRQPLTSDGRRRVQGGGCCEFVHRLGSIVSESEE